ncbi:MAG: class I SAM-dependent methyltransferase [Deltaproteobacteria bacterium]|nr:class I SAM-dependent methyltransferase [Deltaproteobacteria bacterium]
MNSQFTAEESRIKRIYSTRDTSNKPALYAWHREEVLLNAYRLRSVAAALLSGNHMKDMAGITALDVGCGSGGWLRTLVDWGASPENLHGIDLLGDRIEKAKISAPGIDFRIASGFELPYAEQTMALVSAHTVFSSILDGSARKTLAREMARVLIPTGAVFIYDYRVSHPRNKDTTGIRRPEIQRLFPGFFLQIRSLTLAPPVARRIAPVSPLLAHFLEKVFPFLRTHAIYFLKWA